MKNLRRNIRERFWTLFEEMELYDPFIAISLLYQRQIGWCCTVNTSNAYWATTPILNDGSQTFVLSKHQHQSFNNVLVRAYIDMARALLFLRKKHTMWSE